MSTESQVWNAFKPYRRTPKDRQGQVYTHTFLNGGSFIVPNNEEAEKSIFSAIEADMNNGVPFYINEIATEVFKMFLDFDFYHTECLTDQNIADILSVVHKSFARFFPDDILEQQSKVFVAIVLHAVPPKLCASRSEFKELLRLQDAFTGKGETIQVENGSVRSNETLHTVQWLDAIPQNGFYQCVVKDGVVQLLTTGSPAFRNPQVYKNEYKLALRTGAPPANAVSVTDELKRIGDWSYPATTVFAVDESTYFVNMKRNATGLVKHGIHVVFPWCQVRIDQALYMREALVDRLIGEFGNTFAPDGWSTVVDNAVYGTGRGLRMFGAHKTSTCAKCRGKRDVECGIPKCKYGKIDEGRPYLLHSVFKNGERDEEMESIYRQKLSLVIKHTSIRTDLKDPIPSWTRYSGCPQFGDMLKTVVKEGNETEYKIKSKEAVFKDDKQIKCRNHTVDVVDPKVFQIFEKNIRTRFVKNYSRLRVTGVRKTDNGFYFITVAGEGQHWCLNKAPPGDHKSNTIYFQCDKEGLYVRCRCPKPTVEGRSKGMCKDFKSSVKPLDISERAYLFPQTLTVSVTGQAFQQLPADVAMQVTQSQIDGNPSSKKPRSN